MLAHITIHIRSAGLYLGENKHVKEIGTIQYECHKDKSRMCAFVRRAK